ncbi:methyltransferase type 12 [Pelagibius litoralis]|uniref:Methyltransferase type 12 n=1 Tax=Pelagibius litoralis TaxID=374515 RepID=A0A967KEP5_9PROT|nr:methyltransferase type 12 [Pelagibius litoralis]NIA70860.1 methyltransferase type 12 [Pelagibius litoralis]
MTDHHDASLPVTGVADALPGQAVYTPASLRLYDFFVLSFSNRLLWNCPTSELLALYDENVSDNHLDAGVATGFFLDRCRFPTAKPRLGLLDLNQTCLDTASRRVARYAPEIYRANVLEPIAIDAAPFRSIGIMYLLHCLPGPMARKAVAFGHLKAHLAPGGCLFGAAILGRGVEHNLFGRKIMDIYASKSIFGNAEDDEAGLRKGLSDHFAKVDLRLRGRVAIFTARD